MFLCLALNKKKNTLTSVLSLCFFLISVVATERMHTESRNQNTYFSYVVYVITIATQENVCEKKL